MDNNFWTVIDRQKVAMEHKQEIGHWLSESELRRHLAEKSALRHFRFNAKKSL